MIDAVATSSAAQRLPHPRSIRERLPTIPHDLSQFARDNTGPASWSACRDTERLAAWALEGHEDPSYARRTAVLVDLLPTDVPKLVTAPHQAAAVLTHREAFVLASIDGGSSIERLVDTIDLDNGEVLALLGDLCARGLVVIERA